MQIGFEKERLLRGRFPSNNRISIQNINKPRNQLSLPIKQLTVDESNPPGRSGNERSASFSDDFSRLRMTAPNRYCKNVGLLLATFQLISSFIKCIRFSTHRTDKRQLQKGRIHHHPITTHHLQAESMYQTRQWSWRKNF